MSVNQNNFPLSSVSPSVQTVIYDLHCNLKLFLDERTAFISTTKGFYTEQR